MGLFFFLVLSSSLDSGLVQVYIFSIHATFTIFRVEVLVSSCKLYSCFLPCVPTDLGPSILSFCYFLYILITYWTHCKVFSLMYLEIRSHFNVLSHDSLLKLTFSCTWPWYSSENLSFKLRVTIVTFMYWNVTQRELS